MLKRSYLFYENTSSSVLYFIHFSYLVNLFFFFNLVVGSFSPFVYTQVKHTRKKITDLIILKNPKVLSGIDLKIKPSSFINKYGSHLHRLYRNKCQSLYKQ